MRKNILIFGHSYDPQFIDINNQYTQLFNKKNYAVTVVYLKGEPNDEVKQKHLADQVIFLNSAKRDIRGLKIATIKKMLHLTRENNFDHVICHRYKPSYIMMWVALFYKIPNLFFVMHELGTLKSLMRRIVIATLLQNNMIFAGVSDAVRNDIRQSIWRTPKERVITLHNMIDVSFTQTQQYDRETARTKLALPANTFFFGNVGRLVKNKDQTTLIHAFSFIKKKCPHAKLIIMGEGQLESQLKTLVQTLKLDDEVIFTGFISDAFRYMKAFDVYISSSTQEAFGRVLLEAMIARIPIIATRVNGVPEVLGETSSLITAKDTEKLAAAMLHAYQLSNEERTQWGKNGYERAVKFFSFEKFNEIFWKKSF